jgi:uncharacterized protein YndB with AHSA1/START domain
MCVPTATAASTGGGERVFATWGRFSTRCGRTAWLDSSKPQSEKSGRSELELKGHITVNEPDTKVVEQTVRISARPETVWRYWTDPQRMCDWWGAAAELEPRPGGVCRVEMGNGPVMRGKYLELVPYERIVFSFGWEPTDDGPDIAPGSSTVEVNLVAEAGDTILTLRHTDIPDAYIDLHRSGWALFLPLLVGAAASEATTP